MLGRAAARPARAAHPKLRLASSLVTTEAGADGVSQVARPDVRRVTMARRTGGDRQHRICAGFGTGGMQMPQWACVPIMISLMNGFPTIGAPAS